MLKRRIFIDWNGEQFASIWQITDLVEVKYSNSSVHSSFAKSELYLSVENQSWKSVRTSRTWERANLITVIVMFPVITETCGRELGMSS